MCVLMEISARTFTRAIIYQGFFHGAARMEEREFLSYWRVIYGSARITRGLWRSTSPRLLLLFGNFVDLFECSSNIAFMRASCRSLLAILEKIIGPFNDYSNCALFTVVYYIPSVAVRRKKRARGMRLII